MLGRALARVARVVVLTPRLGPMLSGIVPDERVVAVDNGVEREMVDAAVRRDDQERPRPLAALYLSNLMASKGYVTVLEAAALAAARGIGLQFVLAADRTWDTAVDPERFIRDHGLRNVRHCGPVHGDAKAAVLSDADVLVLPTAYPVEGQPRAILEAMHFGLPVVTCEQGLIADVIRSGENGLLVPPRNPAALLSAVSALVEQPMLARRMGELNQRTARARYTEVAHDRAMVGVLRDALAAGTGGCITPASVGVGRGAGTRLRNVATKQRVHHLDGGC